MEPMPAFILLQRMTWNGDVWSDFRDVRVRVTDIVSYQEFRLDKNQARVTNFPVAKIMLRGQERDLDDPTDVQMDPRMRRRGSQVLFIAKVDVRSLDKYFEPMVP